MAAARSADSQPDLQLSSCVVCLLFDASISHQSSIDICYWSHLHFRLNADTLRYAYICKRTLISTRMHNTHAYSNVSFNSFSCNCMRQKSRRFFISIFSWDSAAKSRERTQERKKRSRDALKCICHAIWCLRCSYSLEFGESGCGCVWCWRMCLAAPVLSNSSGSSS